MVLDFGVKTHDSPSTNLQTVIKRTLISTTLVSSPRDGMFSQAFIRRRTQFESVNAFCNACPCDDDTIGSVQRFSGDERDAFVNRTTEFETWGEMKRSAAVADLVTLHNV